MANEAARLKLLLLSRPLQIGAVVYLGRHYTVVRVERSGPDWIHHLKKS
ncbi:hypothetical protein [Deinococcus psychrotolerans]|nr:hypothetical protein [Deinococcus psychrotolerans]